MFRTECGGSLSLSRVQSEFRIGSGVGPSHNGLCYGKSFVTRFESGGFLTLSSSVVGVLGEVPKWDCPSVRSWYVERLVSSTRTSRVHH